MKDTGVIYARSKNIHEDIAKAISENKIVARFYGGSEYGPRALGNRSILANPMNAETKEILNRRIKHREPFRPFAPACMAEHATEYFNINVESEFMLLITTATPHAQKTIPATVHNDNTARVQTIANEQNPNFYKTLAAFKKLTGVPVLINTSFNVNGEAIVETPLDALESFAHMDIDYLAIDDFFIGKEENESKFKKLSDHDFLEKRKRRYNIEITHPLKDCNIDSFYFTQGLLHDKNGKNDAGGLSSAIKYVTSKLLNK
ncbi:MAG TPA: carbamoyltransferase C-terminal domain-containing protein [Bacteroidia bacterium]|nr:carbamoyltransferase C-terminal domain-containing protein [Bacteroidia bacterium]